MSRSVDDRLADVADAIDRARTADQRLQEYANAGDTAGVQLAFDAILYDLFIVGEVVKSLPASSCRWASCHRALIAGPT